jgi:hypothetical protein
MIHDHHQIVVLIDIAGTAIGKTARRYCGFWGLSKRLGCK